MVSLFELRTHSKNRNCDMLKAFDNSNSNVQNLIWSYERAQRDLSNHLIINHVLTKSVQSKLKITDGFGNII